MSCRSIYVTTADKAEAVAIGRALVEARLVACANVFDGVTSIYRWQGEIAQDGEAALVLKTRADLVSQVVAKVRELHSYDVPCVVVWEIVAGNPDYLSWIEAETTAAAG